MWLHSARTASLKQAWTIKFYSHHHLFLLSFNTVLVTHSPYLSDPMYYGRQDTSSLTWPLICLSNIIFHHFTRKSCLHTTEFADASHTTMPLNKLVSLSRLPLPWKLDKFFKNQFTCSLWYGPTTHSNQTSFMLSLHPEAYLDDITYHTAFWMFYIDFLPLNYELLDGKNCVLSILIFLIPSIAPTT